MVNYIIFFFLLFVLFGFEAMTWKSFISSALCEPDKSPSNKRLIIFLLANTIIVCVLMNVVKIITPMEMFITIAGLVASGLGIAAYEKVAINKSNNEQK